MRNPATPNRRRETVVAAVLAVAAAALLVTGVVSWRGAHVLEERGTTTTGVVTDRAEDGPRSTITVRYPVPGQTEVTVTTSNYLGDHQVGDDVDVVYDPQEPRRIAVAGWQPDVLPAYLWWTLAAAAGVTMLLRLAWLIPTDVLRPRG